MSNLLGPDYDYGDEIVPPSENGIKVGGSISQIMRNIGGISYYSDVIGFGENSRFTRSQGLPYQTPMGLRFFIKTGQTCSNGADMYDYVDTLPSGLPGRVGDEIQKTIGLKLRGLGPGIVEDAITALNPMPMFKAVIGSGYPQCKKVTWPVGDARGRIRSSWVPKKGKAKQWITEPVSMIEANHDGSQIRTNIPHQTRWVFDKYISVEEYDATPKTVKAGEIPPPENHASDVEGFTDLRQDRVAAGVLFAALFLGIITWTSNNS